ncbi:hypothetical protein IWX90DRAFT_446100 [Phyllosticta citrichinensis]|uniref:Uncharacterized protein n=1 Tax=Phyllosticta citrichinensis TaxID=1130410 RepID=A0ABR1XFM1_9PEZI
MSASCLLHPPPLPPPLSPLHALSLPRRTTPAHAPSLSRRIPHQPVSQPASQPTRPQTSRHTRDSEDCVPRRVGEMKMVGTRRPKVKSEQRLRPNNSKQDGACGIPKRADYVRGRVVKEAGITKHPRWMMGQLEFSHRRGRGASSGEQFVAQLPSPSQSSKLRLRGSSARRVSIARTAEPLLVVVVIVVVVVVVVGVW